MKRKEERLREAVQQHYQCNGKYACTERAYCRFCDGENTAHECDYECYADEFSEGFLAAWEDALSNQWISIRDSQPSPDEMVLCRMVSNEAIVSGYIYKDGNKYKVATNPDFLFEDFRGYECDMWMPIPSFDEILKANKDVLKRLKDK